MSSSTSSSSTSRTAAARVPVAMRPSLTGRPSISGRPSLSGRPSISGRPSLSGASRIHAIDARPREIPRSLSTSARGSTDGAPSRLNRRSSSAGSLTSSLASLGISSSSAVRRPTELKKNEERLKEEVAQLKAMLEESEKAREKEVQTLQQRLKLANQECEKQEERVDALTHQLAETTAKYEAAGAEWRRKMERGEQHTASKYKAQVEEQKKVIAELEGSVAAAEKKIKAMQRAVEEHGLSAVTLEPLPEDVMEEVHTQVDEFMSEMRELRREMKTRRSAAEQWAKLFSASAPLA